MITIGITGGIGSGKTLVSTLLKVMKFPVYIADTESKKLTATNPIIQKGLIKMFGEEIIQAGILNKKMLADEIFNDKAKLAAVNKLIHPVVMQDFIEWKNKQKSSIVFIETAILFETDFYKMVDKKLLVTAPLNLRIERIKKRDNLSEQEIKARINSQMSDEEKMKLADYIIINDEKTSIIEQIDELIVNC